MRLWRDSFNDTPDYLDYFFTEVYRDADAMVWRDGGKVVSALLLQPYTLNYFDTDVPIGYICGACTGHADRGKGFMSRMMRDTLCESHAKGQLLCALIPADAGLFAYYSRFGFADVMRMDVQRFTSVHRFRYEGDYITVDNGEDIVGLYAQFDKMMHMRPACVQHSLRQYRNILSDLYCDGGSVVALRDSVTGEVAAIAFAVPSAADGSVTVRDLLAWSDDSRNAVLAEVMRRYPGSMLTLWAYPGDKTEAKVVGTLSGADVDDDITSYYTATEFESRGTSGSMCPRGSMRIIDAMSILDILAKSHPDLKVNIRLHDDIISDNDFAFFIDRGEVTRVDPIVYGGRNGFYDYDVDICVLTSMLFGNSVTRDLLDIPTVSPFISLMLD